MNIDERLDRLTERDEALAQSLEILTRDIFESREETEKRVRALEDLTAKLADRTGELEGVTVKLADMTIKLGNIAIRHEQRWL